MPRAGLRLRAPLRSRGPLPAPCIPGVARGGAEPGVGLRLERRPGLLQTGGILITSGSPMSQRRLSFRAWLLGLLLALLAPGALAAVVHHDLDVRLDPAAHRLAVEDRITLPEGAPRAVHLRLHAGLEPRVRGGGASLQRVAGPDEASAVPVATYRATLPPGERSFTLAYAGEIHHPVSDLGGEYARGFSVSPGIIAPDGVFLGGTSHWAASVAEAPYVSFEMRVHLPAGWRAVSQGRRAERVEAAGGVREAWVEETRQEEIFLIAARFTEYHRPGSVADAYVFLREPDAGLAQRYLGLTGRYLQMYEGLIGEYPYPKFALVENFWETGYGMPSFTLLGPRVVRLPFIPYTSYPHEILHNWWGNGVYVDYASGNWAEGLTSYLADHLLKEQKGAGATYRREALQKYADYVHEHRELALTEFRGRHDSVTEAVGYGKTLMVFHMLRRKLGDEAFVAALRRLYAGNAFSVAAWSDVAAAFGTQAQAPLDTFMDQWIDRAGAPELRLRDVSVEPTGDGYRLSVALAQVQDEPAYVLEVPIAVQVEGREQALWREVPLEGRERRVEIELPARPLRVAVDPAFDLFRRLHREEIPPAISQALGAERVLVVLPAAADPPTREAYRRLAEAWQRGRGARFEIRRDDRLDTLPEDRAVWLFGWENRFRPVLDDALAGYDFTSGQDRVTVSGKTLRRDDHAAVLLARNPGSPEQALAWVGAENRAAIPGLARKLPHYGKYGYLGFTGDAPENVLKGQWPVTDSPLTATLADGPAPELVLPPREPLAELPPAFSAGRMMEDVRRLADPALAGRGLGSPGLEEAAEHIAAELEAIGLAPAGDPDDGYFQSFSARTGDPQRELTLRNVVGMIRGADPERAEEAVVVGAHYDHLGRGWPDVRAGNAGSIHPGADDNASGVAVLLELARVLAAGPAPARSLIFAAFTGEEAGRLGSRHYVEAAAGQGEIPEPFGMINLDSVGRLGDGPLYVLGAGSAREWPHIFRGAGYVTGVAVEAVSEPLDASDQVSFIQAGVPAVQLFTGAHEDYHRPTDTADRVDAEGLVRVAAVAREAIDYLAGADGRLTPTGTRPAAGARGESPRRVALGTVPDFAHGGEGVRLSGVSPGSPAEAAGLREGDVVVVVNGAEVGSLRGYADALRALAPGDAVEIRYLRDGESRAARMNAVAR